MSIHPVHYLAARPERWSRLLPMRLVALVALTMLSSFGALFVFAYLVLPVIAVGRLSAGVTPRAYLEQDGPRVLRVVHWVAAVCAWLSLVTERLPSADPADTVILRIDHRGSPSVRTAALRLLTGLPSALVLALLSVLGGLVWLWAALSVLLFEEVDAPTLHYLTGLQRWTVRLLCYQASIVDEYPPFSFADEPTHPDVGSMTRDSLGR